MGWIVDEFKSGKMGGEGCAWLKCRGELGSVLLLMLGMYAPHNHWGGSSFEPI